MNIDEKKMEGAPGGHEGADGVLVEAVDLADEPFHPVAFDGALEAALGDADGHADGLSVARNEQPYDPQGIGREPFPRGDKLPECLLAAQPLGLA